LRIPRSLIARKEPDAARSVLIAYTTGTGPLANPKPEAPESLVIPVVEERAQIGAREVETGRVMIRKRVETHDERIERALRHDDVSIERVPLGREVEKAPEIREEDGVLIVPVLQEELVVRTRLVLKEELRITRRRETRPVQQTVRLRRETVEVERAAPQRNEKERIGDGSDP
jgi:uncharacterized protein (TIGR02271 family)